MIFIALAVIAVYAPVAVYVFKMMPGRKAFFDAYKKARNDEETAAEMRIW